MKNIFISMFIFSVFLLLYGEENLPDATSSASIIIPYEESIKPEIETGEKTAQIKEINISKIETGIDAVTSASEVMIPVLEKLKKITPGKLLVKKALLGDDAVAEVMKVDKKTNEIILKKQAEDTVSLQKMKEEFVELKNENTDGKLINENPKRDSKMILFENSNDNIPPSLSYEFDEEKRPETRFYELENFIPRSINDFYISRPKMSFDNNGIVRKSKIVIYSGIGESVFRDSYNLFQKNELKNSREIFTKLIYYNYRISESAYYIALSSYLVKDYIRALNYLNYAVDNAEKDGLSQGRISGFYNQMAAVYYEIEEYKSGLNFYQVSLSKDPKNTANYNGMGLCYFKLGEIRKALESWLKGMDLGNKECEANYKWLTGKLSK